MDRRAHGSTRALVAAGLAAVVLAAGGGFAAGRAGSSAGAASQAPEPGSIEAVAAELAEGQARERAALAQDLTGAARDAHERMGRVLQQLVVAVPLAGAGTAGRPGAAGWQAELAQASAGLSAVPEGTTEHTVTRGALLGAVELLRSAAADYAATAQLPAAQRAAALTDVAARRAAAVALWQAGAGQLDTLVVAAGEEHVHLFLAPDGDPDSVPAEFSEPAEPQDE